MSDPVFMQRRGVLGLLSAAMGAAVTAPAAAASGIGVKAAASALGVDLNQPSGDLIGQCGHSGPFSNQPWRLAQLIGARAYAQSKPVSEMPPHISEKRSWSRSYKAMVYSREQVIMEAYLDRLRNDQGAAARIMDALGLGSGGGNVQGQ